MLIAGFMGATLHLLCLARPPVFPGENFFEHFPPRHLQSPDGPYAHFPGRSLFQSRAARSLSDATPSDPHAVRVLLDAVRVHSHARSARDTAMKKNCFLLAC